MIDMFGEVRVEVGVLWDGMGRIGVGGGEGGRYSCMLEIAHNVKNTM